MEEEPTPRLEWLILALVVLAALSLDVETPEKTPMPELRHIEGTIELSTQDAMDSLGFEGYEPGAIATVDLAVMSVVVTDCSNCSIAPTGIRLSGEVILTELIDEGGRLGRIEADLSLTHLQEVTADGFIHQEWLILDWDAGDIHIDAEVHIIHDPPRWQPADRSNSAFMTAEDGQESRTGPRVLIGPLLNGTRLVEGCLPDSRGCEASQQPDIRLESTYSTPGEVLEIEFEISEINTLCEADESAESVSIWNTTGSGGGQFAPMVLWLEATGVSSGGFRLPAGTWTQVDAENVDCGTLIDGNGALRLDYALVFD